MDRVEFEKWLGGIARLSLSQRRRMLLALSGHKAMHEDDGVVESSPSDLAAGRLGRSDDETATTKTWARLSASGVAGEVVAEARRRRVDCLGCPHCASQEFVSWGQANALPRYRCKNCGRTFNALTKTPLARLRKKDQWLEQAGAIIGGATITQAAKRCNVHYTTAFRWRRRFLASLSLEERNTLKGILEGDAPLILESIVQGKAVRPAERVAREKRQGGPKKPLRRTSSGLRRSRPQERDA